MASDNEMDMFGLTGGATWALESARLYQHAIRLASVYPRAGLQSDGRSPGFQVPDQASLTRIRPERNEWRFYRMELWPDLFGGTLLAHQWGRIGTQGRIRLDPHPDAGAAIEALIEFARVKRRRDYRDRPA